MKDNQVRTHMRELALLTGQISLGVSFLELLSYRACLRRYKFAAVDHISQELQKHGDLPFLRVKAQHLRDIP
jgi:hypothetical protein